MKTLTPWIAAIAMGLAACGGGDNNTFPNGSSGDDASGGDGGNPFGNQDGSGGDGSGGGDGANACSAPVDMFIMQDRSGSMGTDCNIGATTNSKWCHAINALSGYFNSPSAAGNAAALQFFPLTNHTSALCATGAGYDVAALPTPPPAYETLPTKGFDALLNATNDTGGGGTPTEAAIRGLTKFTSGNRRGGRVTIGILITDGDPNGCDQNLTNLSNLLQAHFTATTLRTYVIGMTGANFANLEAIAQGGNAPLHPDLVGPLTDACGNGAGPCRSWNVGDGNPQAFVAALAALQESADGCKDGGGTINPN
ncbi:MAG TPA: vWA domain-containing protein [Polyangiaceae bacterium]